MGIPYFQTLDKWEDTVNAWFSFLFYRFGIM